MAFFDWNKDGKIDIQDAFLEYNIFKACTEDDYDNENIFNLDDGFDEDDDFFDDMDEE